MTAPYWRNYLCRERTMCSLCHSRGQLVRIGPPLSVETTAHKAAHRIRQRAAFLRHVAETHPDLRVRWSR